MVSIAGLQLLLPLPAAEPKSAPQTRRFWIVAPDSVDGKRFTRLLRGTQSASRFSHAFVDAGSGYQVFAPDDVILVRVPDGEFLVLLPEPERETLSQVDAKRACAAIQKLMRSQSVSSRKGETIEEIIALSFTPGKRYRNRASPLVNTTGDARTGLERILFTLRDEAVRANALLTRELCNNAERGLNEDVHPALRALLRREYADAYSAICAERSGWEQEDLNAINAAYRFAENDFAIGGLPHHAVSTRRRRTGVMQALRQPSLPGLQASPTGSQHLLGYCARRMFGLPLYTDGASEVLTPNYRTKGTHLCCGSIKVSDDALWHFVRHSHSRHRRLLVRLEPDAEHIRICFGLRNELHAMLGMLHEEPRHSEQCAFLLDSPSLGLNSEVIWAADGAMEARLGVAAKPGRHEMTVSALTGSKPNASLNLKFTCPLEHPLNYA